MYLSRFTEHVNLVVRGSDLNSSMSSYLSERIAANPRVRVRLGCELRSVGGERRLESVTLEDKGRGTRVDEPSRGVFVFIGAVPATQFLGPEVARDTYGFLLTGPNIPEALWPLAERPPLPLESSSPGLLAAGDCRAGSTKRVAFAVGDGALAATCLDDLFTPDLRPRTIGIPRKHKATMTTRRRQPHLIPHQAPDTAGSASHRRPVARRLGWGDHADHRSDH